MIRQFTDDTFLLTNAINRARLSLHPIFANSLAEYETNFVSTVEDGGQNTA